MYSNYLEFNKKITGYGCIAITLIMNKIANTASNVIIRETGKKCYGKKPLYQNVYNTIWRSLWCFCITSISWTFVTFNLHDIITPSSIFWHPLSIRSYIRTSMGCENMDEGEWFFLLGEEIEQFDAWIKTNLEKTGIKLPE